MLPSRNADTLGRLPRRDDGGPDAALAVSHVLTPSAMAPPKSVRPGIDLVVSMVEWAPGLLGIRRRRAGTAKCVNAIGHGLQMPWVDA